jgi:hypothetical protein
MRFATSLFAALVLAGSLANAAQAQVPGVSKAAPGPYSVYGPGLTYRQDSSYTGPYSVYGPGLTYRQDSSYAGPYSARLSSASSPAQTRTYSESSLRTAGLITQSYVRISIAGNANQAIVIP